MCSVAILFGHAAVLHRNATFVYTNVCDRRSETAFDRIPRDWSVIAFRGELQICKDGFSYGCVNT